jgi:ribonucleotide reductase alpha subunit
VGTQGAHRRPRYENDARPELWNEIAEAAWASADPGIQFDTTINEWNTCPLDGQD